MPPMMSQTLPRPSRRTLLAGMSCAAIGLATERRGLAQVPSRIFDVADFGAVGDGRTNDTRALFRASQALQREGGGTLLFERKTYIIGEQAPGRAASDWAFEPHPVIDIRGCPGKILLAGNGARLRSAPGLRYGTFNRRSGRATRNAMPFTDPAELASPYRAALWLQDNHGEIEIEGFDLDGRINDAVIGGPWGDTGWQINHCGIWLYNNRGAQTVRDVVASRHGQDGILIYREVRGEDERPSPVTVDNARCEFNGRQGISLTGGRYVTIRNCQLNKTGKNGVVASNPGAGLDIEAELGLIRDVSVSGCEFVDNYGQGFVADQGDSARMSFDDCRFVGTTNYAAWPHRPGIRFSRSTFVGAVVRCFDDPDATSKATTFSACTFLDDPAMTPDGKIYGGRIDLGGSGAGTLFDGCVFRYTHEFQLPYSDGNVRYRNCTMAQASPEPSYPRGIYTGRNVIRGAVRLGGSRIAGEVNLNGRLLPVSG